MHPYDLSPQSRPEERRPQRYPEWVIIAFDADATRWAAFSGNPAALSRLPVHEERDESTGSTTRAPTDSHGGPSGPAFPGPMRERDEVTPNRKDRPDVGYHDVRA